MALHVSHISLKFSKTSLRYSDDALICLLILLPEPVKGRENAINFKSQKSGRLSVSFCQTRLQMYKKVTL